MFTRRAFLQTTGTAGMAVVATFGNDGLARVTAAARAVDGVAPSDVATDARATFPALPDIAIGVASTRSGVGSATPAPAPAPCWIR